MIKQEKFLVAGLASVALSLCAALIMSFAEQRRAAYDCRARTCSAGKVPVLDHRYGCVCLEMAVPR